MVQWKIHRVCDEAQFTGSGVKTGNQSFVPRRDCHLWAKGDLGHVPTPLCVQGKGARGVIVIGLNDHSRSGCHVQKTQHVTLRKGSNKKLLRVPAAAVAMESLVRRPRDDLLASRAELVVSAVILVSACPGSRVTRPLNRYLKKMFRHDRSPPGLFPLFFEATGLHWGFMTDTLSSRSAKTGALSPRLITEIPGPESQKLHARRQATVSGGVSATFPVYAAHAHDAIIVDVDGNQFLDLTGGIGVMTIGHTNDAVVDAIAEQAAKVTHTLFAVAGYEPYIEVCELLARHTPGDFAKKSVLVNSGAEAVENAVKIARKHTGRTEIAVLHHGYHGRTNLTSAMNYNMHPYGTGFGPLAGSVHHAPNSSPFHDGLSGEEAAERTITYLEKRVGASQIACLVVEPIQGEGGFIVPAKGYLPALLKWCHDNGIVYVSDEVQSGMARTGSYFASDHFGIVPDMVTSAKGIGGGMPIAAVTGRAEIMDSSHPGGLGGTFGGNPVSCAAVVAVFSEVERLGLLAEAKRIEKTLMSGLEGLKNRFPHVADVRGIGAMIAIEFHDPATGKPSADIAKALQAYALQQGVLILTAGSFGNVLRLLPSLVITDSQLEEAVAVMAAGLESL